MKVGDAESGSQDMDEKMSGEVDGRGAVEGEWGREHGKAWRRGKRGKREKGRGMRQEDMIDRQAGKVGRRRISEWGKQQEEVQPEFSKVQGTLSKVLGKGAFRTRISRQAGLGHS